MKPRIQVAILAVSLVLVGQAWGKDLPDACGDEIVRFDVISQSRKPMPDAPPSGKAQIIFIESVDADFCLSRSQITTRAGVDGGWVGANKGRSYFAYNVAPGKHQLCADWQRVLHGQVDLASLTAEEGKTYYFLVSVTNRTRTVGETEHRDEKVRLLALSEPEGRRRLEESDLAVAHEYK